MTVQKTTHSALRHAITTMVNDDLSEPGTEKRARFVEQLAAMEAAAEALEEANQIRTAARKCDRRHAIRTDSKSRALKYS